MTEITARDDFMPGPVERFVVHWGEMGANWGVNRSVAQIHALLYLSETPLTAEDISERLGMARSNVSTSLRELLSWNLIRRVHAMGDRRDFYEAEADVFEMVRRIAQARKTREIDPAIAVLRTCLADAKNDTAVGPGVRKRLASMLDFTETVDRSFGELIRLPAPTLMSLIRMGGTVARFVGKASRKPPRQNRT
ncbi:MarR family transcriptional regulator [Hyphomicrobium sp. NDB2Meth4]|uniref:GbsR/MarR family transcriptional regulator n=1 Tax=Hyphomicrobium sp. NDB2Meth4 TaxID=1892846 RepID=UPI0009308B72|nr:MarR family transcriptional regulator [Hyphomicrobium sp. NDB2Meth4]